jgi:hypothetical protein
MAAARNSTIDIPTRRFMMHHTCRGLPLLLAPLLIDGFACCGEKGLPEPPRAVVQGDVTWQGKPIEQGTIRFISEGGPSAQGPITKGAYKIDDNGGVPVGTCRVEIQGFEEQDIGDSGSTLIQMPKRVGVPIIPKQFNAESTLSVAVEAEKQNQHDFHLQVQ